MPTLRAITDVETILIGSVCNSQQMFSKRAPQGHSWMHSLTFQPHRVSDQYSVFSYKLTWGLWKHPTISVSWRSLWMSVCGDPQIILGHLEYTGPGARDIWSTPISPSGSAKVEAPICCWSHGDFTQVDVLLPESNTFYSIDGVIVLRPKGLHLIALPLFHPLYECDINL